MWYVFFADVLVVLHVAFVLFVVFGGLLIFRWQWMMKLHLPAVAWGALVEYAGWVCPLTPLENWLRVQSGMASYQGGFIERYLLALLYPEALTRDIQLWLGTLVVLVNVSVYGRWWVNRRP